MPTKQPRQPPLRSPMQAEAQTLVLQEAGPEDVDRLTAMEAACFAPVSYTHLRAHET